ncbi:23269_t:CDS:2 [Entrophospora sp. SA101]|nr:23269_t:CDS:2 [Entrophospora sp. SA101]
MSVIISEIMPGIFSYIRVWIIRAQIAGDVMHFNIMIKDMDNINQLYNLYSIKIPVRSTGSEDVFRFIEALLNLRNILIINLTILYHSPKTRSLRLKKSSSTVSSEED